ncbi:MAG: hypothetical protein VB138_08730 [Burkholderia sp.]
MYLAGFCAVRTGSLSAYGDTRWLGPAFGEHTDEVLGGLGYDAEPIAALRERRVI